MPRKLRLQYPGAIYHVTNRGDQRDDIFWDDRDHEKFLAVLGAACAKTDWQVHAYATKGAYEMSAARGLTSSDTYVKYIPDTGRCEKINVVMKTP